MPFEWFSSIPKKIEKMHQQATAKREQLFGAIFVA
jgi:hypothetical protein